MNMGKSQGLKVKQALITSFRAEEIHTQSEGNSASEGVQNPKDRDCETEEEPVVETSSA